MFDSRFSNFSFGFRPMRTTGNSWPTWDSFTCFLNDLFAEKFLSQCKHWNLFDKTSGGSFCPTTQLDGGGGGGGVGSGTDGSARGRMRRNTGKEALACDCFICCCNTKSDSKHSLHCAHVNAEGDIAIILVVNNCFFRLVQLNIKTSSTYFQNRSRTTVSTRRFKRRDCILFER